MYRQNPSWQEYYRESDPVKRGQILEENLAAVPDDGANAYRKLLYEKRYGNAKNPEAAVDRMLYQCVNFVQLSKSTGFFKRFHRKEVLDSVKALGMDEWQTCGEAGAGALYAEIQNAAARYFETCKSASYRRMMFGLVGVNEEDRGRQICGDVWNMTQGISRLYGLEEELRIWNDAVLSEYIRSVPGAEQLYQKIQLDKTTK